MGSVFAIGLGSGFFWTGFVSVDFLLKVFSVLVFDAVLVGFGLFSMGVSATWETGALVSGATSSSALFPGERKIVADHKGHIRHLFSSA